MARYVTRKEDAFGAAIRAEQSVLNTDNVIEGVDGDRAVRRPLHAMELHEDTYSTITVRSASGDESKTLVNTSHTSTTDFMSSSTSNLIIQSVSESREEKQQIVQTFGEDFVYFFGERPVMTRFTAILPDSVEFQYAAEFWRNYERVLRGTSLVTRNLRAYVSVGRKVYEGYLVSASTQRQADQPRVIQLTFTLYTTRTSYLDKLRNQRIGTEQSSYKETDRYDYIVGGYDYAPLKEAAVKRAFAEVLDIDPSIKRGSRSFSLITGEYLSSKEEEIAREGGFNRPSIASKPEGTADITENFDWESPSAPSTSLGDVVSTLMTGAFVLGAAVEIVATAQEEIADLATTIRGVVADPAGAFINSAAVNSVTAGLAGRIGRGELQLNKPTLSNPRILLTSPGTSGTFDGVLDI